MNRIKIFISSVQREFSVERKMLAHYLRTDVLLGKFFEPFIFEEQPAVNLSPQQVYLREVEQCDIYLGIVGGSYGFEDNEGIVNAICHRDYTSNGSVQVMLFRNRLEVWNPGQLPFGMTIENLYKPHRSLPVNPLLAEPMYWNGYIEKIGSGTEDMVKRCLEYGLRKPDFIQNSDFMTILWRSETNESHAIEQVRGQVREQVKKIIIAIGYDTKKREEIMEALHLKARRNFLENYLYPAMIDEYVSKLYPESDKRPDQAYYLTEKGLDLLTTLNEDNSMIL